MMTCEAKVTLEWRQFLLSHIHLQTTIVISNRTLLALWFFGCFFFRVLIHVMFHFLMSSLPKQRGYFYYHLHEWTSAFARQSCWQILDTTFLFGKGRNRNKQKRGAVKSVTVHSRKLASGASNLKISIIERSSHEHLGIFIHQHCQYYQDLIGSKKHKSRKEHGR